MNDKPKRPAMTKARRLRIWEKEKGICYLCGHKVQAGEAWDAEHVKCWELYHDDSDENLRVAHKEGCHQKKTNADVKIIRKADRQAGNKGQYARRMKNGPQIKSRNDWPRGVKIQSRPWPKKGRDT
jgi:hypothetical protein